MSDSPNGHPQVARAFQHTVMFWVLAGLAMGMFAPAALLPVYRDYAAWRAHRARAEARVAALRERADNNQRIIHALKTDPGVNARIMARDLGHLDPGHRVVKVLAAPARDDLSRPAAAIRAVSADPEFPVGEPEELKPWEAHVEQRLTGGLWMTVFAEPVSRSVMLVLSAVLLLSAVVLYPRLRAD